MNRRAFFGKLFGGAAAGVAVTLYPASSLGLLERIFYRKKKSIFLPLEEGSFLEVDGSGEIKWEVWNRITEFKYVEPFEFVHLKIRALRSPES